MIPRLIQRLHGLVRHAHLNVVVPVLVAAGLLSYVASLASTPHAARELVVIAQHVWWIVLVLNLPYLAARLYVWHNLLQLLNLKVPFRRLLLAFAAGEMTKSVPAGIYVENYLLRRLAHQGEEKTVRSTVTTTAILGLEAALAFLVMPVVGLPGAPWVRLGVGALVGGPARPHHGPVGAHSQRGPPWGTAPALAAPCARGCSRRRPPYGDGQDQDALRVGGLRPSQRREVTARAVERIAVADGVSGRRGPPRTGPICQLARLLPDRGPS